jgi:hypothetical protein
MIELIGDQNAPTCVDGVCAVPAPEPKRPEDAERRDDESADAGPGLRVPVQR